MLSRELKEMLKKHDMRALFGKLRSRGTMSRLMISEDIRTKDDDSFTEDLGRFCDLRGKTEEKAESRRQWKIQTHPFYESDRLDFFIEAESLYEEIMAKKRGR